MPPVNKDAAQAVFDILVRNLRYGVITLAVVGDHHRGGRVLRRAVGAGEGDAPVRRRGDRRGSQQGG